MSSPATATTSTANAAPKLFQTKADLTTIAQANPHSGVEKIAAMQSCFWWDSPFLKDVLPFQRFSTVFAANALISFPSDPPSSHSFIEIIPEGDADFLYNRISILNPNLLDNLPNFKMLLRNPSLCKVIESHWDLIGRYLGSAPFINLSEEVALYPSETKLTSEIALNGYFHLRKWSSDEEHAKAVAEISQSLSWLHVVQSQIKQNSYFVQRDPAKPSSNKDFAPAISKIENGNKAATEEIASMPPVQRKVVILLVPSTPPNNSSLTWKLESPSSDAVTLHVFGSLDPTNPERTLDLTSIQATSIRVTDVATKTFDIEALALEKDAFPEDRSIRKAGIRDILFPTPLVPAFQKVGVDVGKEYTIENNTALVIDAYVVRVVARELITVAQVKNWERNLCHVISRIRANFK
jgi:hypothetical protein